MFNDATNTLSDIYYPTTNLFMIKALNIVDALYDCISQEEDLKPFILVMKAKWCSYYANIPIIYLLWLIFDPRCKLDMLTTCLENYYNFLDLEENDDVDVDTLVSYVKSTFYSLYDEYLKIYGPSLNINAQPDVSQAKPPPSIQFGKRYPILFHKSKKAKVTGSSQSLTFEFQNYLTTAFKFVNSPDFDILQW